MTIAATVRADAGETNVHERSPSLESVPAVVRSDVMLGDPVPSHGGNPMTGPIRLFSISCSLLLVLAGVSPRAAGQGSVMRGRLEPPDVYEFAPPLEYEPRYEHDKRRRKVILNPGSVLRTV